VWGLQDVSCDLREMRSWSWKRIDGCQVVVMLESLCVVTLLMQLGFVDRLTDHHTFDNVMVVRLVIQQC